MKNILCYGDSNTWGARPDVLGERYERHERWTGLLQAELGTDYYVIEEGLNGRTTVWDDPIEPNRSGKLYLPPCLLSHRPLDLVLVMLGTNDLKSRFNLYPSDVARGVAVLVELIQHSAAGRNEQAPPILLLAPALVTDLNDFFREMFAGAAEKSRHLAQHYQQMAQEWGCKFFNAASVVKPDPEEGLHLNAEGHHLLAKALAPMVRHLLMD